MGSKSCCSLGRCMRVTKRVSNQASGLIYLGVALFALAIVPTAAAGGDAPQWMHALAGPALPSYDEKTDAVVLYSETSVTVLSEDRVKTHVREVYKILRPEGRDEAR